jgi:hypothetical protein
MSLPIPPRAHHACMLAVPERPRRMLTVTFHFCPALFCRSPCLCHLLRSAGARPRRAHRREIVASSSVFNDGDLQELRGMWLRFGVSLVTVWS